ncbi:MAG: alpha/beta fold hydrolase [Proteobacteria bacterium]|nr:alpha/beta fold hydrolase [Pseudomonadota bacterium]
MSMTPALGFVPGAPRIAYEAAGSGATLVCLHGIGGNRRNWHAQLRDLADVCCVVAWDARGYGDSDDYEGPLAFTDFAADLLRLLDHLGVERAHLCGLSMGGRIALDFYERHAGRVQSLILVDTFPGFDASFTQEGRERFVRERRQPLIEGKEPRDIAPAVARTLVSPKADAAVVQQLIDSISMLHKASYIKTIEAMTMYQPVTDVGIIDVPVQIIVGADDKLTPPAISRKMADGIRDARLLELPDTGHLSNIEAPDAFNACVRDFLKTLN